MSAYLENSKDDLELKTQILQLFSNFKDMQYCSLFRFSFKVPGSKALKN